MIKVSENDKLSLRRHYKSCGKSWEGMPEEEGLNATSENRGCVHDMLWQTVPIRAAAKGKADGGQLCTTDIQQQ